jgi:hypothetical protein
LSKKKPKELFRWKLTMPMKTQACPMTLTSSSDLQIDMREITTVLQKKMSPHFSKWLLEEYTEKRSAVLHKINSLISKKSKCCKRKSLLWNPNSRH